MWSVALGADGSPRGPAQRLTLGRDERSASSRVQGRIAFMAGDRRINIWSMPLNRSGDAPSGEPRQITDSAASDYTSTISSDGQTLIFRSTRSGFVDVWASHPPDARPISLTSNEAFESIPRLSTDGKQVAFSVNEQGDRILYTVDADGHGATRRLCDNCGAPIAWTPSGDIIYQVNKGTATFALYHEGATTMLFSSTPHPIYAGSLSRDGRWFVFKADLDDRRTQVFITPFDTTRLPIDIAEWIPMTAGESWDDIPRFSPDNRIVYLSSDRDGFRCIWARRFDPATKQPQGDLFPVKHFHGMDLSLSGLSLNEFELSVGPDELVFPLLKQSGNIWMLTPAE
ncbi:MAG: hypothetical protein R2748_07050 [Bryobacterales bacterium]